VALLFWQGNRVQLLLPRVVLIMVAKSLLLLVSLMAVTLLQGQYTLNGNASRNDCHCYTLTNDNFRQSGSVWNNNKISLLQSFDFKFDVFLGCVDSLGADGIAFVLQPISTSVGTQGGGLGYSGVRPAVGVTIDTWQNGNPLSSVPDADPPYDHIAIQLNGDLDHKNSAPPFPVNSIAGPVTALANSDNIEDCQWHILRILWDQPNNTMTVYMDGVVRLTAVKDFVTDVFNGDPFVFWGFTGSTGGAKNLQQVCTALKPVFRFMPDQKRCIGESITFYDSTISFAPIARSYWDFGDGSPIDSTSTNPVHRYTTAGNFQVIQTVLGADGCVEVNTQQVIVGSKPRADFTFTNACVNGVLQFSNTSTASVGTINKWFWDFGNGDTSTLQWPAKSYTSSGVKSVQLAVSSLEGCTSDTTTYQVRVFEKPVADFQIPASACLNRQVQFNGLSRVSDGTISGWIWNLDSTQHVAARLQNPMHAYTTPGTHLVSLSTISSNGCVSAPIVKSINILPRPLADIVNALVCLDSPVTFADSSTNTGTNIVTQWWWQLGNGSTSTLQQPVTTYTAAGNFTVQLVVTNSNGCLSDTIKKIIQVSSTPLAIFGYTAPLCENKAIVLTDASVIGQGSITEWYWKVNNGNLVTGQSITRVLTAGSHQVQLWVKNNNGCSSDTTGSVILVNPSPVIDFVVADACKDAQVFFSGIQAASEPVGQWRWQFGNGGSAISKDTQQVYRQTGTFPVALHALSQAGCSSDTVQKNINIYATNAFAGNDTIAATNRPLQLQGSGGTSYEWRPSAGLSNPLMANPVAIINSNRSYILRAFTTVGCESFDTIRIRVFDGPELYVPRAFTPNGDGLNELLKVLPVGMQQFKQFSIYNRLGQMVFTTNVPGKGWDGFFKGSLQPAGAYLWIAEAVGLSGNLVSRKGTVLLLR